MVLAHLHFDWQHGAFVYAALYLTEAQLLLIPHKAPHNHERRVAEQEVNVPVCASGWVECHPHISQQTSYVTLVVKDPLMKEFHHKRRPVGTALNKLHMELLAISVADSFVSRVDPNMPSAILHQDEGWAVRGIKHHHGDTYCPASPEAICEFLKEWFADGFSNITILLNTNDPLPLHQE